MHSGDSACSMPPFSLRPETIAELEAPDRGHGPGAEGRGLMNVQFAIEDRRASSCSRSTRAPAAPCPSWPRPSAVRSPIAAKLMAGKPLSDFNLEKAYDHIAVKEAVFPFARFPGVDTVLGPEMRSTGEVMGLDFAGFRPRLRQEPARRRDRPADGLVFVSVKDADKPWILEPVKLLLGRGFKVVATGGTRRLPASKASRSSTSRRCSRAARTSSTP